MTTNKRHYLCSLTSWCVGSLLALCGHAFAAPAANSITTCAALLSECLAKDGDSRDSCFYAAAIEERCKGNELGRLSFMRATTGGHGDSGNDSLALLGPQVVDNECIGNFDNQLSSELIRGKISSEVINSLSERLSSCRRTAPDDMFRP